MYAYKIILRLENGWEGVERHKKAKNKIKGDVQWRQCNVPRFLYLLQLKERKIPAID